MLYEADASFRPSFPFAETLCLTKIEIIFIILIRYFTLRKEANNMAERRRVLLVSNDADFLDFFQRMEHEVILSPYTCAEAVLDFMKREGEFDILLLDVMMPTMDGIELCIKIRTFSHVPVKMFSTWRAPEGKIRGLDLNDSTNYLSDPISLDKAVEEIEKIFERNAHCLNRLIR